MSDTYSNGCPRVAWCIECDRPVALTAYGDLVPHRKLGRKRPCMSGYITLEEHRANGAAKDVQP